MLKQYKNYITEATLSFGNFEKAVSLILSMLAKKSGHKFYRYGGKNGYVENIKGNGILYFYNKNKAIRFNHSGTSFSSISLWYSYKMGKNADLTIDLGEVNVISAAKKIIDIVLKPVIGTTALYVEDLESPSGKLLSEAKRISPDDFYHVINNALGSGESISSLTWERMSDIAISNDFQIPTVVRTTKVGKGSNSRFDLTKLLNVKDHDKAASSNEPIYYLKITAQDPISKKFQSVKGDKRAESFLKTMNTAIENPTPEMEKAIRKNPNTLFAHMENLVQVVARKKRNSLVVLGGPGIGKSHQVFETLKNEGKVKDKDWILIKGKITTSTLYQTLFMHRKGTILVFDDCDSVWSDNETANILKAALDSYDKREISWYTGKTVNLSLMTDYEKEEFYAELDDKLAKDSSDSKIKFPSSFDYEGHIIFISNLPMSKMDDAVLNRSMKIDMDLTQEEIFERLESILPFLGKKDVTIEAKKEILTFLRKRAKAKPTEMMSIRTFIGAEDVYASGLPNWVDLMDYL